MDETRSTESQSLAAKIGRLVEERGWNQEEFARITRLNRHTVRQILRPDGPHRLRNATIGACARALGLTVNDLRTQPLDRLLDRMVDASRPRRPDDHTRRLYEEATQGELLAWLERNPERARALSREEVDELLSLQESFQGGGGPLTVFGVAAVVERLDRRRKLVRQVQAIAGTEYLELLEKLVGLLHEKIQPGKDQTSEGASQT